MYGWWRMKPRAMIVLAPMLLLGALALAPVRDAVAACCQTPKYVDFSPPHGHCNTTTRVRTEWDPTKKDICKTNIFQPLKGCKNSTYLVEPKKRETTWTMNPCTGIIVYDTGWVPDSSENHFVKIAYTCFV